MSKVRTLVTDINAKPGRTGSVVVLLPALLNRTVKLHGPVLDVLASPDDRVLGFDSDPRYAMVFDELLDAVVDRIGSFADSQRVTLVGTSMGGMQVPFVAERLQRQFGNKTDWLRAVIVDAPSGVETMIAALRNKHVGAFLTSAFGQVARPVSWIKVGPKDEFIEVPSHEIMQRISGRVMSPDEWRAWVKATSLENLKGFSGANWLSMLRWMITVGRDGSLARSCEALDGVQTTYFSCVGPGNDVVSQPSAVNWWKATLPALKVVDVPAVHPGYLQQVSTFRAALA